MNIFLYGTLLDPVLFAGVAGPGTHSSVAATLEDHVVLRQADSALPILVARTGGRASGMLLRGLSAEQRTRLDAYELPFDYDLRAVTVIVDGSPESAHAYYPAPHVGVSDERWDIAEWDAAVGALSREAAAELAATHPPVTGADMVRQWPMILGRAAARLRAAASTPPATVRRQAAPDDVTVERAPKLTGSFFRFGSYRLNHRSFSGDRSPSLIREVFIATDAALVLPYDPETDRVLLVEQFRMGPFVRGSRNPWMLEPVAGMLDGDESPENCARREADEEAGLTDLRLEKMFGVYASPGGSTDYFHCFLGLCALPEPTQFSGGLVSEHEDLRLHVLPFAQAFDLIASGEADAGPLVAMLLWLDRARDRLRGIA